MKGELMKIVLILMMIAANAFADHHDVNLMSVMKDPAKCPQFKVTDEQKVEIKAMMKRAHEEMVQYKPAVNIAQAAVDLAYLTPNAPRESAESALMILDLAKMPIKQLMQETHRNIEFDILSGTQRAALQTCKIQNRRNHDHLTL
jgi:hypothetical protein